MGLAPVANTCINLSYLFTNRELSCHPSLAEVEVFGMFRDGTMEQLKHEMRNVELNRYPFSSVARPTTGIRMTSLWGLRVRDNAV